MFLIDSHCHFDRLNYKSLHKDVDDVLEKASVYNVKFCLSVSTSLISYRTMRNLVGDRDNVAFSCGIHPLNQNELYTIEDLYHFSLEEGVIAIGETGLDYQSISEEKICQQQESFRNHIRVGCALNKPIIVHTRNAINDTLKILKEEHIPNCGAVLHCFTENKEIARKILDLGCYISFSGIVTFYNAEQVRDTVRYVPLDRLLIESDSPYLAPVPHRKKENQPAMIRYVAEHIVKIKRIEYEELLRVTTKNFSNLFHVNLNHLQSR